MLNQGQIVSLQLWNLKRLFQSSNTLEQFVTVDETGYPVRHKGRMVQDILIAEISNDTVQGKINKKGSD